jgi:nucleotide-binding universal stress UspA family protein
VTSAPGRLVVGVDDLLDCRSALDFAAREAASMGCHVEIVHVRQAGTPEPAAITDRARVLVRRMAEAGVEATVALPSGPVEQALVGLSRGARLMVVEHRRVSRLTRHRIPSTAAALAGRLHCSMVSVPQDWHASVTPASWVTVGIDAVDQQTDRLVRVGFELAAVHAAGLRLVHAWSMSTPYDDAIVDTAVEEEWARAYLCGLEELLVPYRTADPSVTVAVEVTHQDAAKALLCWSEHSDLVLLGRGRSVHPLVDGLGSVPRALLEDARCPVQVLAT